MSRIDPPPPGTAMAGSSEVRIMRRWRIFVDRKASPLPEITTWSSRTFSQ